MGLLSHLFKLKPQNKKVFPPVPQWRPDTPVNHNEIMTLAKLYTQSKLQIAVFKHGTVVLCPLRVDDINKEAKTTLAKIYNAHPDFRPITQEDGNYLIEYTQPAFTIVFKEELERYWDYIEKSHQQGVCNDEVLINGRGEQNVFDNIGKICLFGRAKMFMDAQDPQAVLTYEP